MEPGSAAKSTLASKISSARQPDEFVDAIFEQGPVLRHTSQEARAGYAQRIAANLLDQDADSLRQLTWSRQRAELYHYRTKDKVEVDIALENRRRHVVAIDIKAGSTVRAEDFRGLRHLADHVGDDLVVGVLLYTGQQTLPFGPRLRAIPLSALWETSFPVR